MIHIATMKISPNLIKFLFKGSQLSVLVNIFGSKYKFERMKNRVRWNRGGIYKANNRKA